MRARIERAVHTEQHSVAEHRFNEDVKALFHGLVASIRDVPHVLAASPGTFDDDERSDDIAYWTKPDLPRVVSSLCELERLVGDRVAAVSASRTDIYHWLRKSTSKETAHNALYTALVGQLVSELITPIRMLLHEASTVSFTEPSSVWGVRGAVRLQLAASAEGLFASDCTLLLPACIYVGWRCCFRLLDAFRRMLHVSEEDSIAGWLDTASAILDSLNRISQDVVPTPSALKAGEREGAMMDAFRRNVGIYARVSHCYWWWWSFTYAFGSTRGWMCAAPSADVLATRTNRDDFIQLWCAGRMCATRFLSSVLLPATVHVMQTYMTSLVFGTACDTNSAAAAAAAVSGRMQRFADAVKEVQALVVAALPPVESAGKRATASANGIDPAEGETKRTACPSTSGKAAVAGFMRLVVHDALRPIADRILNDPSSLQVRAFAIDAFADAAATPTANSMEKHVSLTPVAATAVVASQDGWDESDSDSDGEGPLMTRSAITPAPPSLKGDNSDTERGTSPETDRHPSNCSAMAATEVVAASRPPPPPAVTCVRDALVFALDTLERECGQEIVLQDTIAMTLRRLL
ncbi:hypothetical protein ABL78_7025 [Leptomonas seymouri]|uniref:Uncharacterized protein n=1 Tax=Leptomonas seymouri TaxID=5684 RepID=A0A0N1PAA7_LEPSE|nr:hypothetical protein ABL78_7025 [Leptomonas seymouri]|eukprot:KPI83925.1 hypothetical protein ABL78_7025 [Leptomonas seymouri]